MSAANRVIGLPSEDQVDGRTLCRQLHQINIALLSLLVDTRKGGLIGYRQEQGSGVLPYEPMKP